MVIRCSTGIRPGWQVDRTLCPVALACPQRDRASAYNVSPADGWYCTCPDLGNCPCILLLQVIFPGLKIEYIVKADGYDGYSLRNSDLAVETGIFNLLSRRAVLAGGVCAGSQTLGYQVPVPVKIRISIGKPQ
ncbi:hypothetical protein D3C80_989510 [compost metagenome]